MTKYRVPMDVVATNYVEVEADDFESAIEAAYAQGVPGLMNLDHTYPDVSDVEVPEWYTEEYVNGLDS